MKVGTVSRQDHVTGPGQMKHMYAISTVCHHEQVLNTDGISKVSTHDTTICVTCCVQATLGAAFRHGAKSEVSALVTSKATKTEREKKTRKKKEELPTLTCDCGHAEYAMSHVTEPDMCTGKRPDSTSIRSRAPSTSGNSWRSAPLRLPADCLRKCQHPSRRRLLRHRPRDPRYMCI